MAFDSRNWHSTPEERELSYPCDALLTHYDDALFRAIDVDAPPAVLFRWLCQLRAAPYSYDWIDNLGRRSPRELTPGVAVLEIGQTVQTIFKLADFEDGRQITLVMRRGNRAFGEVVVSYVVFPRGSQSRLVAKMLIAYKQPRAIRGLARRTLPFGDAIMMRKQFLNLKKLAEKTAAG